jgi:saccharopine dehydrogenase-like NADP-dependent oxidoreductase
MLPIKVLVLGSGHIGRAIAHLLDRAQGQPTYRVTLADRCVTPSLRERFGCIELDADAEDFGALLRGHDLVVNALPFHLASRVARAAAEAGVHYFDLTEDLEASRAIRQLAHGAATAFMPQCGLAPGFIAIAGYALAQRFDKLERLHMRVGALPQYPCNALKYNLTWSVDGLINEYCHPCEAIVDGGRMDVPPLEGYETFALDGVHYEAFNTSGGLGTLAETLASKARYLDYKTIRYPGHRDIAKLLLQDFGLAGKREVMKDILHAAIPATEQDVVIVFVTASGLRDGQRMQESFARKVYAKDWDGMSMTAIQITTASGVCAVVDLFVQGRLPRAGFVRQEDVALDEFLGNRFGRAFAATQLDRASHEPA